MKVEAICHIPKSNYAYAYRENVLHIRIRTAKNDLEEINLIYGNKFDWKNTQHKQKMRKVASDIYFDYYQSEIQDEDKRIGYYFELVEEGQKIFYTEAGLVEEFNNDLAYCYFYQYPYINPIDVHQQPKWISDSVFYQIFVERFHNGDPKISPPYLSSWDSEPQPKSFFGGDLQGIIDKLDYLTELGINAIYLTPIFQSPSNHKYDIVNYFEVDPFFGDHKVFKELVDKAHAKGIRIVLDAVFNHCSNHFAPFEDVVQKGRESEYFDWFFIEGDKVATNPPNYLTFANVGYMPKLNTANPKLKEYLFHCVSFWTKEFEIDGWRLDVSDEIDHVFWREFRKLVKDINSEAIIIGENRHDSLPWLMGDQFDSVMNYSVTKLCLDYFARKEITAKQFEQQLGTCLMRYSDQVNEAMLNLLDSHDTERFLYSVGGNKELLSLAAAFIFAYKGIPCTYYGTEIGMSGGYDPGCRRGFDWNEENWDKELYQRYKDLIAIRKSEKALQYGTVEFHSTEELFVMKRSFEQETILVLINNSDKEQDYVWRSEEVTKVTGLLSAKSIKLEEGTITLTVAPFEVLYLKLV